MSEVIITAGGTREKIDDVRYVGNFSSGRLGHAIAETYGRLTNDSVILLTPQSTIDRFGLPDNVTHESFMSARDLREKLIGIKAADVVIHSAAVSDYTPIYQEGKIRSDAEELTITMKRNPKILAELRQHFGTDAMLVGFKLLSDVSDDELKEAAIKQIQDNDLDFCVANDLQKITSESREVYVIDKIKIDTAAGLRIAIHKGNTAYVAEKIYDSIAHRIADFALKKW